MKKTIEFERERDREIIGNNGRKRTRKKREKDFKIFKSKNKIGNIDI